MVEHANSSSSSQAIDAMSLGLSPLSLIGLIYLFHTKTCQIYFVQNGKLVSSSFSMLNRVLSEKDDAIFCWTLNTKRREKEYGQILEWLSLL